MRKDKTLNRFVHVSCVQLQQVVVDRDEGVQPLVTHVNQDHIKDVSAVQPAGAQAGQEATSDAGAPTATALPHGLADSSLGDYAKEWDKYVQFAAQRGSVIPGRDIKWDMDLVWEYLQFRATTCKPETVKQVLTKLAHFGTRFKFVLATSKADGDAYVYRSLTKMKRQLAIDARASAKEAGTVYEPVDRCVPVAKRDVSMVLSAFRLTGEPRFNELLRVDRHHVAALVMQHTGGMRFGGFGARCYTMDSFLIDAGGTFRLVTDWGRYPGQYTIEFAASPRFEAMWYHIFAPCGDLIDTYPAATILHWHFRRLQRDGERQVFAPVLGEICSRDDRQAWIRTALWDALPLLEREAHNAVADVTPHSFRAGLAGDLFRAGVSLQRIASICRWHTPRVVRMYAERPALAASRLTDGFRLIERVSGL